MKRGGSDLDERTCGWLDEAVGEDDVDCRMWMCVLAERGGVRMAGSVWLSVYMAVCLAVYG